MELPEDLIDPRTETAEIEEDEGALLARMSWGLAELRAQQRLVLVLHYYEHLSYEEISRFLEVPVGTVMSRLHRARQALREMIQNMDTDQETSMIEEDKFKQEVLAEIAVLLRMFPGERSAQERLAVVLENSPKRLGDFLRNTDDGETLGNLALLLPAFGTRRFRLSARYLLFG